MSVTKIQDFDITTIKDEDVFFLDTNILFFIHSGYYAQATIEFIEYSNIVQKILSNGNSIYVSALNIQELLNGIENKEYLLYIKANGFKKSSFTKKDFRSNTSLRLNVKKKLLIVIQEIENAYNIVDGGNISLSLTKNFATDYENHHYDPIDYYFVKNTFSHSKSITYITDDRDFQFDSNINVITK